MIATLRARGTDRRLAVALRAVVLRAVVLRRAAGALRTVFLGAALRTTFFAAPFRATVFRVAVAFDAARFSGRA